MLRISNIKLKPEQNGEELKKRVYKMLKISECEVHEFIICKKSIDAREKPNIKMIYSVDISLKKKSDEKKYATIKDVALIEPFVYSVSIKKQGEFRPVIIGSGPSGLFAALILAEANLRPIVIERGKNVEERSKDVDLLWQQRIFNEMSNVQFGEGGAGTFSDGKLNTGVKDNRRIKIIEEFINAGAPEEIGYLAKPHIGTDKLIHVLTEIREKIISLGGEFRFSEKLVGIKNSDDFSILKIEATNNNYELKTKHVVLAIGHSARDTMEMLFNLGIKLTAKPFSVGVRIEHPQELINKSQYGQVNNDFLGAAEYKLSTHLENGRGVYTFCMCPGGVVVAANSEPESIVTNGMSYFARDGKNANSAVLVSVSPSDFDTKNPLSGIEFQRKLERDAFVLAGRNYNAPVQLVGDFLNNVKTRKLGAVSPTYLPGVTLCNLHDILSPFIGESLKLGLAQFDKKLNGFAMKDAVLTGVETRSSSPITIFRNVETHEAINFKGVYPCGEGAGHAGGIISAAIDGIKIAEQIINDHTA